MQKAGEGVNRLMGRGPSVPRAAEGIGNLAENEIKGWTKSFRVEKW
jgi:hypothetical protein